MLSSKPIRTKYSGIVARAVRNAVEQDELGKHIHSIALYGSLTRGDFVEGESDIDLLVVVDWPEVKTPEDWAAFDKKFNQPLHKALGKGLVELPVPKQRGYLLDVVSVLRSHLPFRDSSVPLTPEFDYLAFKFFGVYRFDLENWKILYGDDFRDNLREVDSRTLIPHMARNVLRRTDSASSLKEVVGLAVLSIRLAQIYYGEETLDKRKVMENFRRYVPEFPHKHDADDIWRVGKRMGIISEDDIAVERVKGFIVQLLELLIKGG